MKKSEMKYLDVLSRQYPTIASAATEIINLRAILSLPKGTEHFISDIHGEYEQFIHIMNNGSGAVRRKIDEDFGASITSAEKRQLGMLIYYPELKLKQIEEQITDQNELQDWYRVTIFRLVLICKNAASKYTRSKVRKALPQDFAYIIEELMTGRPDVADQEAYYHEIVNAVIETGRADELIVDLCKLTRRFVIDHLHVLGDIYDRGPYPNLVMDELMKHHSVDIQWGNHDVLWMGAAAGSEACMANMMRISAKYGNLPILEDNYGINIIPLMRLAMDVYADDPCTQFKLSVDEDYETADRELDMKMHKAIAIIQFKLEGEIIKAHPEWDMFERNLLETVDVEKGTVTVEGVEYPLTDTNFPTLDPNDPYKLTPQEEDVVKRLKASFLRSDRLQRHIRFMYAKGGLYKVYNGNLLFHGCVPLNEDGSFMKVNIFGKEYYGKALYDVIETYARKGFFSDDEKERKKGQDILWFTWISKNSPVFGKSKMTTFERYFIADKETHKEPKNPYYLLYENEEVLNNILAEFGLPAEGSHIINGHVPVKAKKGESPAKCNGKLLVIDGGFSKPYQKTTGLAGYTLIYNSYGLVLTAHQVFKSMEETVLNEDDAESSIVLEENVVKRKMVADTDNGKVLQKYIDELEALLKAYRSGEIAEKA
ncbi:MAG: fructose-1,6-bisphosphatase [Eubacterium sp.]|nr:fructose-1,6-bisphosphatase [Eubacterium sp.]